MSTKELSKESKFLLESFAKLGAIRYVYINKDEGFYVINRPDKEIKPTYDACEFNRHRKQAPIERRKR